MNHDLFTYCLGVQPNDGKPSSQCRCVQRILPRKARWFTRSAWQKDSVFLTKLLSELDGTEPLQDDTYIVIRALHGCGGSEGYVLDDPKEEAHFWSELQKKHPTHAGLCSLAADSALLIGNNERARRLFLQAMKIEPESVPDFPIDMDGLFLGSNYRLEYQLCRLARTRIHDPENFDGEVAALRKEYEDVPSVQARIDKLRSDSVQTERE